MKKRKSLGDRARQLLRGPFRPWMRQIRYEALCGKINAEISLAEARFLGKLVSNLRTEGPVVEVGTHLGFSTYILTTFKEQARPLISVDNYCWNALGLRKPQQVEATRIFLKDAVRDHHVTLIDQDKDRFFAEYRGARPALVFLDADHGYEATRKDIEWAIKVDAGVICGHDYRALHPGVIKAVDEFGGYRELVDSVWVLKRPA